jgi:hypothetical protein
MPSDLQKLLDLGLIGLGVYFAIMLIRGLLGYARYRRLRPSALATWPAPRASRGGWALHFLGLAGAATAVLNAWAGRPLHHVLALVLMAAYFLGMVPLSLRIRLGLYRDGVWADRGFLRWADVGRLAFQDEPEIVLVLKPRRGSGSFQLPVPPGEYGLVRKVLEEKTREGALRLETPILGI